MNLFDVYPLFNIEIVKGKGCHVWDTEGNEYLCLLYTSDAADDV